MKDHYNFDSGTGICYIPEEGDVEYNTSDFLDIAKQNVKLAIRIFDICEWQHPETVFEEGLREGEWDEEGNILIN